MESEDEGTAEEAPDDDVEVVEVEEEDGIAGMGLSVIHLQTPESAILTNNRTFDFLSILAAIMATFFI